jgi:hypothetical protein
MELKQFSEELLVKMKGQIEQLTLDQPDAILRSSQIISAIESVILELKQVLLKYKFKSSTEEINFFKTIKPVFISQLWFYKKLFKIHLFETFNNIDKRVIHYHKILKSLERFILKHQDFYHYLLSGAEHMDDKYFIRNNSAAQSSLQDERFSTGYDNKISRILMDELIKDYIFAALHKIDSHSDNLNSATTLNWTGSKTDLIELIYALHASKVFNGGAADVKQIASNFETILNVTLGNYYRTFQEIRLRKTGQLKFLEHLKKVLQTKIEENEA